MTGAAIARGLPWQCGRFATANNARNANRPVIVRQLTGQAPNEALGVHQWVAGANALSPWRVNGER